MTWNYRVIRKVVAQHRFEATIEYYIHEVYYDGEGQPEMCSMEPCSVGGESLDDVRSDLKKMEEAVSLPILNYEDF